LLRRNFLLAEHFHDEEVGHLRYARFDISWTLATIRVSPMLALSLSTIPTRLPRCARYPGGTKAKLDEYILSSWRGAFTFSQSNEGDGASRGASDAGAARRRYRAAGMGHLGASLFGNCTMLPCSLSGWYV